MQLSMSFSDSSFEEQTLKCFFKNIEKSGYNYQEIDIGDITFKSGQIESIHRWYRLTPSYSPELVRFFIREFSLSPKNYVFDPFSGRGTTAIECQKKGIPSISYEINPILAEVGSRSLFWTKSHLYLFEEYFEEAVSICKLLKNNSPDEVAKKLKTRIPIIHDVYRWWQPSVLKDLMIFRQTSLDEKFKLINNFLWLSINKASIDCANIHRNHPTITFDDNHQRKILVDYEIKKNLDHIKEDLISLSDFEISNVGIGNINLCDSINIEKSSFKNFPSVIITSPPYPNRFSYVHQTRPQLYFMEAIKNKAEATNIDLKAIGGTWGRATSNLQKNIIVPPKEIMFILDYYDELKTKSILMCNYATKYFLDMWQHIKNISLIVSNNFRGAYVIGNSRLSGIEIFTEVILAKLFEKEGFTVEKIISFRKRGGRKKLYETAIIVKK